MATNGWKAGSDPTLRVLRALAAIVLIATIPLMVVLDRDPVFGGAIIIGLLVLLGIIETTARLPDILGSIGAPRPKSRRVRKEDEDEA